MRIRRELQDMLNSLSDEELDLMGLALGMGVTGGILFGVISAIWIF